MMTCETPNDLLDPFYPDGNFILNMTDIEQTYPLDIKISTISISLQTGIHLSYSAVKITTLLGST